MVDSPFPLMLMGNAAISWHSSRAEYFTHWLASVTDSQLTGIVCWTFCSLYLYTMFSSFRKFVYFATYFRWLFRYSSLKWVCGFVCLCITIFTISPWKERRFQHEDVWIGIHCIILQRFTMRSIKDWKTSNKSVL